MVDPEIEGKVTQVPLKTGKVTPAENQSQSPQTLNLPRQSLRGLGHLLGATNIVVRQDQGQSHERERDAPVSRAENTLEGVMPAEIKLVKDILFVVKTVEKGGEVGMMTANEEMKKGEAEGRGLDLDPERDGGRGPGPEIAGQDPGHETDAAVVAVVKERGRWILGKRLNRNLHC